MNLAGVGQVLQGIGIAGTLVCVLWLVARGSLVTKGAHDAIIAAQMAVITEMGREIARLEGEIGRLESALGARGDDD